jgi:transposase
MLTSQYIPSEFSVGLVSLDPPSFIPQQGVEEKAYIHYLNLPGLEITEKPEEGKSIIMVKAEQARIPTFPDCECLIKEVKPHTPFLMGRVLDMPYARKSVVIDITRRRWRCKTCGKTVTQPLEFMAEGHYRMTRRLLEYLEVQSLCEIELSLSEETGVFVRTIREIREKFVERLKVKVKFDTPRVLGLDGVRADSKRRRVIITDIEAGLVLDLLQSGSKKSIRKRLRKFPGWENIRYVTIDMCRTLLAAVLEALPDAIIIIDLFHIIRTANQFMDRVRSRLYPREKKNKEPGQPTRPRPEPFRKRRATLTPRDHDYMKYWFKENPELQLAYNLKEDFLEIFDEQTYSGRLLMNKAAAKELYKQWKSKLPVGEQFLKLVKDLKIILSPMQNWGEYIFNYFDHHYTNAFTESKNRKIKDILRDTRGCNFETMHARIVYGTYLRKLQITDREREMKAVLPHSKRKPRPPQPKQKGKSAAKGKGEASGRSKAYELPDGSQIAFNFTN